MPREVVEPGVFRKRLKDVLSVKNRLLDMFGHPPLEFEELHAEFASYADQLRQFVGDIEGKVQETVERGGAVMFEGAQGTFLDLDHGTYPYVTSSHPVAAGACLGTGIGPRDIDNVLGVAKAYTTRVGSGPFPTELLDDTGDQIRHQGNEYGTTTGRPRRCGWLDLVALRHSCKVNSMSGLVLTRIDVLAGVGSIKVCTAYRKNGRVLDHFPSCVHEWDGIEPVYETLPGWDGDIRPSRRFEDLPDTVQDYVRFVEGFTSTPAAILSVGPDRSETMVLKPGLVWG